VSGARPKRLYVKDPTMENPLRVVIVEDNPSDAELIVRRLKNDDFHLEWTRVDDEEDYLLAIEAGFDLILSDWSLPDFSGLQALKIACDRELDTPFIIISGSIGEESAVDALHQGASDYLLKDRPERLPQAVRNAMEQKRLRDQRKQAEKLLLETSEELRIAYDATLQGWSSALELREYETAGHSQRVVETTLTLARAMGIKAEDLVHIQRGALLHDIGKMGIPDSILLKPGPLSQDEWVIMRQHPIYAYNLLSKIPFLFPALDIPNYHHKRWDGSGYPKGLKGKEIPLAARIFAVVDVWDALSHDRPYRLAWEEEKVIDYLKEQAGREFDPQVVNAFFLTPNVLAGKKQKPVFNKDSLMERLMGDEELVRIIIAGFLEDIPLQIQSLKDFLNAGDSAGVERQAHTIKGASANIGGEALSALANVMEKSAKSGDKAVIRERLGGLEAEFERLRVVLKNDVDG